MAVGVPALVPRGNLLLGRGVWASDVKASHENEWRAHLDDEVEVLRPGTERIHGNKFGRGLLGHSLYFLSCLFTAHDGAGVCWNGTVQAGRVTFNKCPSSTSVIAVSTGI